MDRVRVLAADQSDRQIAERLNAEGLTSGKGEAFTAAKVQWVRLSQEIRSGCPERPTACEREERGDGRCSAQHAAKVLRVSVSTIATWCKSGRLDGVQAMARGLWWVMLTPEIIEQLRKPVQGGRRKRSSN